MVDGLLPAGVAVVGTDSHRVGALFPVERSQLGPAVEQRQREFATGRTCARAALAKLGIAARPIPIGRLGAPVWPRGTVGSITHCTGYCAAAVAFRDSFRAIGIDAEPNAPLPAGVIDVVAAPKERDWLSRLALEEPRICWDRLLFSLKESLYKACSALTARSMGYGDAVIAIDGQEFVGSIDIDLSDGGSTNVSELRGRWACNGAILASSVAITRS